MLRDAHSNVFVFRQNGVDGLFPKRFSGRSIEADEMSLQVLHVSRILAINTVSGIA